MSDYKPRTSAPVRFVDDEFHLRCEACARSGKGPRYWPMTLEFWDPRKGLARCRACLTDAKRRHDRRVYWANPERNRAYLREYRAENHDVLRIKHALPEWRERRAASDRERYKARRDELLAKKKAYYYANREAILAKRKAAYWSKVADGDVAA